MKSFIDIANPWVPDLLMYEPGKPIEEVARELGIEDPSFVLKLASNENSLGPSPMALKAMQNAMSEMHRYPDGGAFSFKKALADKLDVDASNILPGTGSNELIELLSHVFLEKDTNIVVADKAFIVYKLIAALKQADVIAVPMKDLVHDLGAMLKAINKQTRIVFICNPNNPTGTMVNSVEIEQFMKSVPDHVVICFDEAYIELLPPEKQLDVLKYVREGRNVVVLRTFSKTYGLAGLRIGYAVAPASCINLLNRVRQPFNVNAMAMVAAIAALEDSDHVQKTRKMLSEGISFFEQFLDVAEIPFVPTVVNFILVRVENGRDVFERLRQKGIIVRCMDVYGLPEYIRITIGTRSENERVLNALSEVLNTIKGLS